MHAVPFTGSTGPAATKQRRESGQFCSLSLSASQHRTRLSRSGCALGSPSVTCRFPINPGRCGLGGDRASLHPAGRTPALGPLHMRMLAPLVRSTKERLSAAQIAVLAGRPATTGRSAPIATGSTLMLRLSTRCKGRQLSVTGQRAKVLIVELLVVTRRSHCRKQLRIRPSERTRLAVSFTDVAGSRSLRPSSG